MENLVNYSHYMIVAAAALNTYKAQHTPSDVLFCLKEAENSCYSAGEQAVIACLVAAHVDARASRAGDEGREKLAELLTVYMPVMSEDDVEENFDKVFCDDRIPYVIRSSADKEACFQMAV